MTLSQEEITKIQNSSYLGIRKGDSKWIELEDKVVRLTRSIDRNFNTTPQSSEHSERLGRDALQLEKSLEEIEPEYLQEKAKDKKSGKSTTTLIPSNSSPPSGEFTIIRRIVS